MTPMDRIWLGAKFAAFTFLAWWAGLHSVYRLLLFLQAIDVITGVLVAYQTQSLASAIGHAGLRRKTMIWFLLLGLNLVIAELAGFMDLSPSVRDYGPAELAAAGFAFMEFLSIVENATRAGVRLPSWLISGLAIARKKLGVDEPEESKVKQ